MPLHQPSLPPASGVPHSPSSCTGALSAGQSRDPASPQRALPLNRKDFPSLVCSLAREEGRGLPNWGANRKPGLPFSLSPPPTHPQTHTSPRHFSCSPWSRWAIDRRRGLRVEAAACLFGCRRRREVSARLLVGEDRGDFAGCHDPRRDLRLCSGGSSEDDDDRAAAAVAAVAAASFSLHFGCRCSRNIMPKRKVTRFPEAARRASWAPSPRSPPAPQSKAGGVGWTASSATPRIAPGSAFIWGIGGGGEGRECFASFSSTACCNEDRRLLEGSAALCVT